jgi:L,D-peptidoglycan transpeptidase YkuD (ErfK/YbiS/YcfS/YnhG family)
MNNNIKYKSDHWLSYNGLVDLSCKKHYCVCLKTKKELNLIAKMKNTFIIIMLLAILLTLFSVSACVFIPAISKLDMKIFTASQENKIGESAQILLVIDNSSFFPTKTNVYAMEKRGDNWQMAFEPFNAVIGVNGFAEEGEKKEGDGKTPSGIYPLKLTFGYDATIGTKMPYRQAMPDDIWVDDSNSDDYNRWVKKSETRAASYELMKRDDNLYKYGVVIEYNTDPVIMGNGSAIFLHIWKGKGIPTAGCVAVSEENIIKIIEWLDPQASPVIIMGMEN